MRIIHQIKWYWIAGLIIIVMTLSYYNSQRISPVLNTITASISYPLLVIHKRLIQPCYNWIQEKKARHMIALLLAEKKKECELLRAENIALHAQLHYLDDIEELRIFKKQKELVDTCIARILVRHFSDQSHYFLIDAGSKQGIEPSMVVVNNNSLIGKVVDVYPWYSKVALITDRSCKVAGFCAQTDAPGIHVGVNHEHETIFDHVSHLADIIVGDIIVSSGQGLIFPYGFALGKVTASYPDGLYQKVLVEPLCDFRTVDYCLVLLKNPQHES